MGGRWGWLDDAERAGGYDGWMVLSSEGGGGGVLDQNTVPVL